MIDTSNINQDIKTIIALAKQLRLVLPNNGTFFNSESTYHSCIVTLVLLNNISARKPLSVDDMIEHLDELSANIELLKKELSQLNTAKKEQGSKIVTEIVDKINVIDSVIKPNEPEIQSQRKYPT